MAGVFLVAIDPAAFGDAGRYAQMVAENLGAAKRVPPAAGHAEVLLPGEPEVRTRTQRGRDGVFLPEETWRDLAGLAASLGLPMLEPR